MEHSWEVLGEVLQRNYRDIILDIGMCVVKDSSLYNCRVIVINSKIALIRPKTKLAGNGNYREERWFTAWPHDEPRSSWFVLPDVITKITGQKLVPFGANIVLELADFANFKIGWEICEELWRADSSNVRLFGERGCHLICNSSGSYWEIRKLDRALELMKSSTSKCGGCYAFSNMIGCDGQRLCFYGRSLIAMNGQLVAKTSSSSEHLFEQVQVATVSVDAVGIDAFRRQNYIKLNFDPRTSMGDVLEFHPEKGYGAVLTPKASPLQSLTILVTNFKPRVKPSPVVSLPQVEITEPAEELFKFASLWLFDYLRKSAMSGFIVPLSGGIDSSSVACIVYAMCSILFEYLRAQKVLDARLKRLLKVDSYEEFDATYSSPKDICGKILRCVYLATKFSGQSSYNRAKGTLCSVSYFLYISFHFQSGLCDLIGAEFVEYNFNHLFEEISENAPNFSATPRGDAVTLLEQNIQARLRMVLTYYFSGGDRLVLAAGNVDEALVGYLTKYDCSSADLNPIGSISKSDLRLFMRFFEDKLFGDQKPTVVDEIVKAMPSAELTGEEQSDELEVGLTYDEQVTR